MEQRDFCLSTEEMQEDALYAANATIRVELHDAYEILNAAGSTSATLKYKADAA